MKDNYPDASQPYLFAVNGLDNVSDCASFPRPDVTVFDGRKRLTNGVCYDFDWLSIRKPYNRQNQYIAVDVATSALHTDLPNPSPLNHYVPHT